MAETLFIFCPFLFGRYDSGQKGIKIAGESDSSGEFPEIDQVHTADRISGESHITLKTLSVNWAIIAADRTPNWRRSTLDDIPPVPENTRVCVVLPGEQVLLTEVVLKGKKARHLRQALPYLVEESLASEIENMHIVSGSRQPGERFPVAAIDTPLLDRILGLFETAKITIDLVIPDTLLLPFSPRAITLHIDGERCLLRYSTTQGLAIDNINLTTTLEAILRSGEFDAIRVYYDRRQELEHIRTLLLQLRALQAEHSIEVKELPLPETAAGFLSKHLQDVPDINLLQGKVALEHRQKSPYSAWKTPAAAAIVLLLVYSLYNLGSGYYLDVRAQSLYRESETLYRQYFPNDNRIINIKTQTETHLRTRAGGSKQDRFLQLMGRFGLAWQSYEPRTLMIQHLRFDRQRGQLTMDIQAASIQHLEQFRQALLQHGLNAELLSANEEPSAYKGFSDNNREPSDNKKQQPVRGHLQLTEAG